MARSTWYYKSWRLKILGCGIATARSKFDETNFPIIKNMIDLRKADKEAVKLYLQGKDYMEYKARTVSNRIQREILETLKEIKDIIQNPIATNDKARNKSFNLKCYISNENEINWNIYIKITLKNYVKYGRIFT